MVNEHKKQEEAKIDLQKQLDAERKKLADLEKIAKEKSQTKISIKMPEASADGSATDKYLQNFADNKPEATQPGVTNPETTSMPIHLKITSENGQVQNIEQMQNVEQVSNQSQQPAAEEQTVKAPTIEKDSDSTIRIRLNQKEQSKQQ